MFITLFFGTFIAEDLTCIAAGLAVAHGAVTLPVAIAACAAGIWLGDLGLWLVGRALAAKVLSWRRVNDRLPPDAAPRLRDWFEADGRVILASRLVPGTRLPLYLAAGACRTSLRAFAVWTAVAVGLWTPVLVTASLVAGARIQGWLAMGRIGTVMVALLTLIAWRFAAHLGTVQGRQRLAATISRLWRWEFWPMWLFYAPVAMWTAWLALRHGGYRTITAANPGIPDGGVVGESKFAILTRLPEAWTVPTELLEPDSFERRHACFDAIMTRRGWGFPLVLKPDVGQRGSGVRLARSSADVREYLAHLTDRILVQPYHAGPFEAGIFYYRRPGVAHGRILAITDKHFPFVVGDGRSTLEELVWSHPRYRMQAKTFLTRLSERRAHVPGAGERVVLGMAGNHAQGTLFTDGLHLLTPELEARIDAIARHYDGFFIGRFDVRYADRQAFLAGRDLAIVELNGATAECTNIYDPDRTLFAAYRALFLQWRLVFEIGAANRRDGRAVTSAGRLIRLLLAHLNETPAFAVSD